MAGLVKQLEFTDHHSNGRCVEIEHAHNGYRVIFRRKKTSWRAPSDSDSLVHAGSDTEEAVGVYLSLPQALRAAEEFMKDPYGNADEKEKKP